MDIETLKTTAQHMVARGKGILAADESVGTCEKRFASVGVPCTEDNRRTYREMLLGTPGAEEYISGVILHDETIRQRASDGTPFPQMLARRSILPGIKVDTGAKDLALHSGEKVTEGLDGLRERLADYRALGARFAKWRAVITIGESASWRIPSDACIHANAHALARYAALCQEADIVPMVEPEVLIDGDHTITRSYEATAATLKKMFEEMSGQGVAFSGVILKASMVIAGKSASTQSSPAEVAEATVRCLKENVPTDLAGVVFLSGGQSDETASANLDAMNKIGSTPWPLTFSFSRALQNRPLKIWSQDIVGNVAPARTVFLFRAKMNSLASRGAYDVSMEEMQEEMRR